MSYTPHTVFASTGCPWPGPPEKEKKRGRMSQDQVWQWLRTHSRATAKEVKLAMGATSDNCVRRMLLELQKVGKIGKTYDKQSKTYLYSERTEDDPRTYRPRSRVVRNPYSNSPSRRAGYGTAAVPS